MESITQETYRQRLLGMQQQIVRRIFELEEEMGTITASREVERTDRVQAAVPEEVMQKLDEQSRREVEDIQAALARLEAGTYTRCEACGEAISAARLDVLPMARRCIYCQKQVEQVAGE